MKKLHLIFVSSVLFLIQSTGFALAQEPQTGWLIQLPICAPEFALKMLTKDYQVGWIDSSAQSDKKFHQLNEDEVLKRSDPYIIRGPGGNLETGGKTVFRMLGNNGQIASCFRPQASPPFFTSLSQIGNMIYFNPEHKKDKPVAIVELFGFVAGPKNSVNLKGSITFSYNAGGSKKEKLDFSFVLSGRTQEGGDWKEIKKTRRELGSSQPLTWAVESEVPSPSQVKISFIVEPHDLPQNRVTVLQRTGREVSFPFSPLISLYDLRFFGAQCYPDFANPQNCF